MDEYSGIYRKERVYKAIGREKRRDGLNGEGRENEEEMPGRVR